jgi:hypothetical protein
MIEELLHWPVSSRKVTKIGGKIEEINRQFCLVDQSLTEGGGIVNMKRFRSLLRKISLLQSEVEATNPRADFDSLVLAEYSYSLFTQKEYLQFFFTKKYSKEWGMRSFLNYSFFKEDEFRTKKEDEKSIAIEYLEQYLKNIDYNAITKRENLMQIMTFFKAELNPPKLEALILEQIPRIRDMISEYNLEMGFETADQIKAQKEYALKNEQEIVQRGAAKRNILTLMSKKVSSQKNIRKFNEAVKKETTNSIYDLVFSHEGFCSYEDATRTISVSAGTFIFYKDPDTGKLQIYTGDVDLSMGHENYHRLQNIFSKNMPAGLMGSAGEFNITGRTITEGTATVLEQKFINWLDKKRKKLGLSKNDITIASLYNSDLFAYMALNLCHALYHRELNVEQGKRDYDAHKKLAEISKMPVLLDEQHLSEYSIAETFYNTYYLFGTKYVNETINALEKRETKRLGSAEKAKEFLDRNEAIVIQGLLTGFWGWATHKEFFLNHYWPKARKYCEKI